MTRIRRTEILPKDLQILDPLEMPRGDRGEDDLCKSNRDIPTQVLAGSSRRRTMLCLVGARSSREAGSGASRESTLHLAKCFRESKLTDQKHKRKTKVPMRPLNKLRPCRTHNAYKAEGFFLFSEFVLRHSSKSHRLQVPHSQSTKTKHHAGVLNTWEHLFSNLSKFLLHFQMLKRLAPFLKYCCVQSKICST